MTKSCRLPFGPPLEWKAVSDDGVFEGYASLFGREDLARDVTQAGAFRESLTRRGAAGIRLLYQHDPGEPIGVWEVLREDKKGLFARGRLLLAVQRAREVLALMRVGALDGLSIGFKTVTARRDPASGTRLVSRIDLWEISVVTFPMLPEARIARLKSDLTPPKSASAREFERWLLDEGRLTRAEARAFLAHGLRGLHALESAKGEDRLSRAIRTAAQVMRGERAARPDA